VSIAGPRYREKRESMVRTMVLDVGLITCVVCRTVAHPDEIAWLVFARHCPARNGRAPWHSHGK
jgi:hypothetical protein